MIDLHRRPARLGRGLFVVGLLLAALALAVLPTTAQAGPDDPPRLVSHQSLVEDILRGGELPIENTAAMFDWVFSQLPDRAVVYPTESYWYFSFVHRGVRFAGNIRLDAKDRDAGVVHFAYFEDLSEWREEPPMNYAELNEAQGVKLEKLEPFLYKMTHAGRSVLFELNAMKGVTPPPGAVLPDETYIGPIFDDSSIRFFLVWNPGAKVFHYVLDETGPVTEGFLGMTDTDRILIGKRTGFAFYRDKRSERKLLIGVFEGNSRVNNAYDGPFDQLPDGFLDGDALRRAILIADPSLAGRIDRFGGISDGSGRYLIAPYVYYRSAEDLLPFHECATDPAVPKTRYAMCFSMNWDGRGELAAYTAEHEARKADKPRKKKPGRPAR